MIYPHSSKATKPGSLPKKDTLFSRSFDLSSESRIFLEDTEQGILPSSLDNDAPPGFLTNEKSPQYSWLPRSQSLAVPEVHTTNSLCSGQDAQPTHRLRLRRSNTDGIDNTWAHSSSSPVFSQPPLERHASHLGFSTPGLPLATSAVAPFERSNSEIFAAENAMKKKTTGPIHNAKYKAKLCKNWSQRGICPYFEKCQFAHGEHEIEKWATRRCKTNVQNRSLGFQQFPPSLDILNNNINTEQKQLSPTNEAAESVRAGELLDMVTSMQVKNGGHLSSMDVFRLKSALTGNVHSTLQQQPTQFQPEMQFPRFSNSNVGWVEEKLDINSYSSLF